MKRRKLPPSDIDKAIERLLKIRPRSVGELRQRLLWKGFPEEEVERALDRLRAAGILDDRAFAQWWIEQRAVTRPMGAYGLRMELLGKRVEREVADYALAESGVKETELELAREALGRRLHRFAKLDPHTRRRRIAEFLSRRGFASGTISDIMRTLDKDRS